MSEWTKILTTGLLSSLLAVSSTLATQYYADRWTLERETIVADRKARDELISRLEGDRMLFVASGNNVVMTHVRSSIIESALRHTPDERARSLFEKEAFDTMERESRFSGAHNEALRLLAQDLRQVRILFGRTPKIDKLWRTALEGVLLEINLIENAPDTGDPVILETWRRKVSKEAKAAVTQQSERMEPLIAHLAEQVERDWKIAGAQATSEVQ